MMALGDILAARADNARARGTVEAGTLGTVTVEALPVRELERLMRGAAEVLPAENTAGDSAGAGEAADTGASFEASDGTAGEVAAHGTDTDKKAAFPAVTSDGRTADNGRSGDLRSEGAGGADENATAARILETWGVSGAKILKKHRYAHIFTHVKWNVTAFTVTADEAPFPAASEAELREKEAFPTAFRRCLDYFDDFRGA